MLRCMNPQGLYLFPLNMIPKNQASALPLPSPRVSRLDAHTHLTLFRYINIPSALTRQTDKHSESKKKKKKSLRRGLDFLSGIFFFALIKPASKTCTCCTRSQLQLRCFHCLSQTHHSCLFHYYWWSFRVKEQTHSLQARVAKASRGLVLQKECRSPCQPSILKGHEILSKTLLLHLYLGTVKI